MKLKNILIFVALFLTIVSTLGFLGFSVMDHNGQFLCPISRISGSECPAENVLNLASHHLSGLRLLTQSIISLNLILLIIPAIFLIVFCLPNILEFLPNNFSRNQELNPTPFKKFFAFLARHNKEYSRYILLGVI